MPKFFKKTAFFFLLLLAGCSKTHHQIQFYAWKSTPGIGEKEKTIFKKTKANTLYLRLFDVDRKKGKPEPQGILQSFDPAVLPANYVPVIFITNRTFVGLSPSENKQLVTNTLKLIKRIATDKNIDFNEIQIDCDWTASTKKTYFYFLKTLRENSGTPVTCTLRLHQVKYRKKSGIPPVNKIYLMCYATSSPVNTEKGNSILDMGLLKNYLKNINDYPIDFAIDLPLYSWGIVTNHIGRKKLINGLSAEELQSKNFKKTDKNRYEVLHDNFLRGIYLNKGFHVKIESISPKLLKKCKRYLDQKIDRPYAIVYFHLDHLFTDCFTLNELL